jgi:uncharacterized tellurite resistance protein B-like protein
MASPEDDWRHVPAPSRVDYLIVVASLVAADHEVEDAELALLEDLCRDLAVPAPGKDAVLATARTPDAARVDASLARLRSQVALRQSLLTDAIVIVFADGKVAPGESQVIAHLAEQLEVAPAQLALIARYVEAVILGKDHQELSKQLGEGVARIHPGVIRRLYDRFRRGR